METDHILRGQPRSYHSLKQMVRHHLDREIRDKHLEIRKERLPKTWIYAGQEHGDCRGWLFKGKCHDSDMCPFNHYPDKRGSLKKPKDKKSKDHPDESSDSKPKKKDKKSKKGMLCRTLPLRVALQSENEGKQFVMGDGLPPAKVGLPLPAVALQSEKTCMQFVNKKRVPPEKAGLDSSHKRVLFDESIPHKERNYSRKRRSPRPGSPRPGSQGGSVFACRNSSRVDTPGRGHV